MTTVFVSPEDTLLTAYGRMKLYDISQLPVLDDGEHVAGIIDDVIGQARSGDHVVIMSNGGFDSIHTRLLQALEQKAA